jgi:hypothetical protein
MNDKLKTIMLEHGLHQSISADCQSRIEMLYNIIVQESIDCCGSQADKKNIRKRFGFPIEDPIKYKGTDPHNSITSQYDRPYNLPK